MLKDLPFTIPAIHQTYRNGTKPVEVVREVYRRIKAINDPAIFIHLIDQKEVEEAANSLSSFDADKPLWGIPFVIKDNIDAKDKPTTAGCPAYEYTAVEDAFVVAQLKAAGAILIGKTNLDQFATGLVGIRSPYGAPKNAIDPTIVPGGSSGGSGVIVSHGAVTFSLGTDTAGSGRVPAALNNIVGLKPTLGALSATGLVPACRTLDTISIFALTVDDAYAAFEAATIYDTRDAYSKPIRVNPITEMPTGLRVGVPNAETIEFFGDDVQQQSFKDAIAKLSRFGANIVEVDFTSLYDVAKMLYEGAWVAERYTVIEKLLETDPDAVYPVTSQIIRQAEGLSAADAFRGIYRLEELKRRAQPLWDTLDILCVPTIPTFYSLEDLDTDPITPNSNFGTYTNFVNLLDMCGIAVPTESRRDGRPGSVTILSSAGQDGLTASVARIFEQDSDRHLGATDWPLQGPAKPESKVDGLDIEIAVCGAHMSGLPLNWQLTELGARFLRNAETAPTYKFYSLAGGPPERPGLLRSSCQDATSIKMEIWSLPLHNVGGFLAGIPSPLGIGSIELRDGTMVKGFLCEAAGLEGAQDISATGDWRTYLSTSS